MSVVLREKWGRREGFTLVEMLVIAPIVLLTIAGFIAVAVNLTADVVISTARTTMIYDTQNALQRIKDDSGKAAAFLATNSFDVTSPQGVNDDDTEFTAANGGNVLILRALATTAYPEDTGAEIIALADAPFACGDADATNNTPQSYNIVYFVRDDSLWRRVVMDSDYATAGCAVPWQIPSCNPAVTNAYCATEDELILEDVTAANFTVEYLANASSTTTTASVASATTVQVTIITEKRVAGSDVAETVTGRETRSYENVEPEAFE